ncbi:hemerythrin domain-containing protein [Clostridium isatidis]|uniref:Hemerythrin n=1 Tax=Clostridium isatidis TaxID=182773 RepID=A0A343JFL3_9CLOT|nr:hemerythrin domain-containing protein [Clostridium isatidis]ASW44321.1 hemerythrin [Clostridium isatidis]NLZ34147.1 hemerythrin domain-containing protein [Clostridiales bacterium]
MNISNLERQHTEIKELFKKLDNHIKSSNLEDNIDDMVWDINTLAGKLNIHMKTEDKFLYPELINSNNDKLKKIATEYSEEMGDIHNIFTEYKNKFNTKNKILSNKAEFIKESQKVLTLLVNRIQKEDLKLYPEIKTL